MVCRRMGLLDDAIREHLELKRRRGADPGLVAREEHDAFGPVRNASADPHDELAPAPSHDARPTSVEDHPRASSDDGDTDAGDDFSHVGQETAELDMRSVLDEPGDDDTQTSPFAAHRTDRSDGDAPFAPALLDTATEETSDPSDQDRLWLDEPSRRDPDA